MDFNKIFIPLISIIFISTSYGQLDLRTSDLMQKKNKTKITICFTNTSSEELILKNVLERMYYLSQQYETEQLKNIIDTVKIDRMGFIITDELGKPLRLEDNLNIKLYKPKGLFPKNLPLHTLKISPNSKTYVRTKILYKSVLLPRGNYNLEIFYYHTHLDKLFISNTVHFEL